MKAEIINNNLFMYIYSFLDDCDYSNIKRILFHFKRQLNLQGFYKVNVCKKKIGLFLKIIKIEDSYYRNTLDFRFVSQDMTIYYKTDDYFLLKDFSIVRYYDGVFYGLVEDSFDGILEKVEFGSFVLENDISNILEKSILI